MSKHVRCDYVDANGERCNEPVTGLRVKRQPGGQPRGSCSPNHAHAFRPNTEVTVRGQRQARPRTNPGRIEEPSKAPKPVTGLGCMLPILGLVAMVLVAVF